MFKQIIEINNNDSVANIVNNNVIFVSDNTQEITLTQSGVQGQRGPQGPQGPAGEGAFDDFPDFNLIFENKLI